MFKYLLVSIMVCLASLGWGQQTINPATQIRWPAVSGTVNPASPTWPCTSVNYGQPYTNVTTGVLFTCGVAGWSAPSGGAPYPGAGVPVSTGTAWSASLTPGAAGTVIVSNGTAFSVTQLTQDQILPAFAITSFAGGSTVELGASIVNPPFTASYSSTPTSAQITNTDGTDSPHILTTPFTSATITGTFSKTTNVCVTFNLTAVAATTKTATQQDCFKPRTFFGVGTGGATGATASGTSAVLVGATGTLGSWGLGTETGAVSVSPSGQFIYFLLSNTGHTFSVNGFPTTFTSMSITFTNVNGAATPMNLYVSPTSLNGTYAVQVN